MLLSSRAAAAAIIFRSCDRAAAQRNAPRKEGFSLRYPRTRNKLVSFDFSSDNRENRLLQTCDWNQVGLAISQEIGIYNFPETRIGNSVVLSADGTVLAVGEETEGIDHNSPGQVRVFVLAEEGTTWEQLGDPIIGEDAGFPYLDNSDGFGFSVALSHNGMTVAIGGIHNDNALCWDSGHVRAFDYHGGTNQWIQIGNDLNGEAALDHFGTSVALSADGMILAIGALNNNGNGSNSGHVRVFECVGDGIDSSWKRMGDDVDGSTAGDRFGVSVSLSSDGLTMAVGGYLNDNNGSEAGHVRLFKYYEKFGWTQEAIAEGSAAGDWLGLTVSLSADGTKVAMGAPQVDGSGKGYVVVYEISKENKLVQLGNHIRNNKAMGDRFGWSVSLSGNGNTLAVGAYLNNENGNDSGHVQVYKLQSEAAKEWVQVGNDLAGGTNGTQFGITVTLSADGASLAVESFNSDQYAQVFSVSDSSCVTSGETLAPTMTPAEIRSNDGGTSTGAISPTTAPTETRSNDGGTSTGVIIGVAFAALAAVIALVGLAVRRRRSGGMMPSNIDTVVAVAVDESRNTSALEMVPVADVVEAQQQLPSFKDQTRNVNHGPKVVK